jgi:hypothetical protein
MRFFLLSLLLTSSLLAEVANMSGSWVLDAKRSRFGKIRPGEVMLTVEHNEPRLKYSGTVNNATEGAINDFDFDGAIDGKEYVVKQDNKGDRRVTFRRVNDKVVESVTHGPEGEIRSRITMSADGNSMERRMSVKMPDGKTRSWVEVYAKKK